MSCQLEDEPSQAGARHEDARHGALCAVVGVDSARSVAPNCVDEWIKGQAAAEAKHGSISGWHTSGVDDLSELFRSKTTFNAQLNWDTSKVTTMYRTFQQAKAFNSELVWDTSQVTNMGYMFYNARAFNQELVWDASSVTTMRRTFDGTALESDDCSKQEMHEAWKNVSTFTNEYNWSANFCSPPSPPLAPPSASPSPPPSASPSPPPSASPSPSPATTSAPESGLGAGEIAGISVGVVLLLLLATAAALRVYQPSVVEKAVALLQRSLAKANAALTSKPADVNVNNV